MKAIQVIVACSSFFGASRAPADQEDSTIVEIPAGKSSVLTVENFLYIRRFVLSKGQRQTYCNMFNDNPFYPFSSFNLYLNPSDQNNVNCDPGRSDFPIMVVQTTAGCNEYWDIYLDEENSKLILLQNYTMARPDALRKKVEEFFREALGEIEKQQ